MNRFIDYRNDFEIFFKKEKIEVDIVAQNHLEFIFDVNFEVEDIYVSLQIVLDVINSLGGEKYLCKISQLVLFCSDSEEPEEVTGFLEKGLRVQVELGLQDAGEATISTLDGNDFV